MDRLKVLFAVAEAYPFAKVGGLADVGGALPQALARRGHDVRLVLPGYPSVGEGRLVHALRLPHGKATELVEIHSHGDHKGVQLYTVRNERLFGRERIYEYDDDDARFILFSKAVVAFAARSDWTPDVIHASEWHLGVVPQHVKQGPYREILRETATVFTIHNLVYQGPIGSDMSSFIGLRDGYNANLLARGIAFADAINTVSRRYMEEILTPEYGANLDGLLRARRDRLVGILNGVDYGEFDPATDPHIAASYGSSSLERKSLNKLALQERIDLTRDAAVPLFGMVCRLVDQKGLRLLCATLDRIAQLEAQVAVMGLGEKHYERALEEAAARNRGSVAYHAATEDALTRMVYAGSDFFLAPSEYEPCGLGPLIALRYAAIPLVRSTGGMTETIPDYSKNPDTGLGFTFVPECPQHLLNGITGALTVYRRPEEWRRLQRRAMAADFSWERPAWEYERLYRKACRRVRGSTDGAPLREYAVIGDGRTVERRETN
jgi:starch synthase